MSYLDELNDDQLIAVKEVNGPTMVIAGAGSGKTRVLTYRIAYMIENGIDPFNILALTFTNKAAREMTERIGNIVNQSEAQNITMGTFHAVFSRILRFNSDRIGFPSNFSIYDTQDSKSLIKSIIKELSLDDKTYKPSVIFSRISAAKNNLISPEAYNENDEIQYEDQQSRRPETGNIYTRYANRCQKAGAMDFDDLLYFTNVLLRDFPDVLHYYQQKFRYILVDEYQDTNFAQYLIVKKLAAAFENICVVGDDAQSIYSFRGANIQNILNFRSDYPDFKLFKLEQNYRSTQNIVDAANSVIQKNKDQIHKKVWTNNSQGNKIKIVRTLTDNEEGKMVGDRIFDIYRSENSSYENFAILYRTNKQSRAFEESLRKRNIPYKVYGGLSFYQRKEIKDLLAYFRLAANPRDEEAIKRVINYPKRGIGKTSIEKLIIYANEYQTSIWDIISDFHKFPVDLNSGTVNRLHEFAIMIQSFHAEIHKQNASDLAYSIAKSSGIMRELISEKDKGPEEVERLQNIEELLAGIQEFSRKNTEEFVGLADFMIEVALLTDADNQSDDDQQHVSLMTIHASKGLEFQHVFIVGLEENLFPSQLSLNERSDLEEERRLFYVALTRAMQSATLSYASSRFTWGQAMACEPSRFLKELDSSYVQFEGIGTRSGDSVMRNTNKTTFSGGLNNIYLKRPQKQQLKSFKEINSENPISENDNNQQFKVGLNVEHGRFGKGKITKLEGIGADKKATIFFPHHGTKIVLLRFAKLIILDQ